MPYKRSSQFLDTFLVTQFRPIPGQKEFFNTHACYHSLTSASKNMSVKTLQTAVFVLSGLAFLLASVGRDLFFGRAFKLFAGAIYVCVLVAVVTTTMRYLRDERGSLPVWRCLPYVTALCVLGLFCLLPLVTWPLALSGALRNLHLHPLIIALFGVHLTVLILTWFGRGWSRLGLTVVNYWLLFLWCIPLAV
jgi:hypothetical protein